MEHFGRAVGALEKSHASLTAAVACLVPSIVHQADTESVAEAFTDVKLAYRALKASFGELERMRLSVRRGDEESAEYVRTSCV